MVIIELSQEDADLAERWAAAVLGTGLERTPNYTGLQAKDRFKIGYQGEIAVRNWLRSEGAQFEYRVDLRGRSAPPEFIVYKGGEKMRLEVKTAGLPTHKKFMMPAAQDIDAEYFVGARVASPVPCRVAIHGWLTRREVEELPIGNFGYGVPTRSHDLATMRPEAELLRQIDNQQERKQCYFDYRGATIARYSVGGEPAFMVWRDRRLVSKVLATEELAIAFVDAQESLL